MSGMQETYNACLVTTSPYDVRDALMVCQSVVLSSSCADDVTRDRRPMH